MARLGAVRMWWCVFVRERMCWWVESVPSARPAVRAVCQSDLRVALQAKRSLCVEEA